MLTRARRPDTADVVVGVAVVVAAVLLLWLGRGLTFFADEWAVMADRTISFESFIEPFNEHWLGVMIIDRKKIATQTCRQYLISVSAESRSRAPRM